MSIDHTIAEIRAALATVSALHAAGNLSRADIRAAVEFVEGCCDEIAALTAPADLNAGESSDASTSRVVEAPAATPFGTTTLPVLTLAGIAAQARAEARRAAGRRHLQLVSSQGDAA